MTTADQYVDQLVTRFNTNYDSDDGISYFALWWMFRGDNVSKDVISEEFKNSDHDGTWFSNQMKPKWQSWISYPKGFEFALGISRKWVQAKGNSNFTNVMETCLEFFLNQEPNSMRNEAESLKTEADTMTTGTKYENCAKVFASELDKRFLIKQQEWNRLKFMPHPATIVPATPPVVPAIPPVEDEVPDINSPTTPLDDEKQQTSWVQLGKQVASGIGKVTLSLGKGAVAVGKTGIALGKGAQVMYNNTKRVDNKQVDDDLSFKLWMILSLPPSVSIPV